jgi:hypothetical protein
MVGHKVKEEKRMIVYVVFEHKEHEESRIAAVFDSEEKADDYIYNHYPDDDSVFWLGWETFRVQ